MTPMRMLGVLAVMVCATAVAACAPSRETSERPRPRTHTVNMEGMVFQPASITVTEGDAIVWVNNDLVPHSATSADAGFDSQVIAARASWRHVMDRKGDFAYICSFHPTMKAELHVR